MLPWATFATNGTTYLNSIPSALIGTNQTVVGSVKINNLYTRTFRYKVDVVNASPVVVVAVANQTFASGTASATYNVTGFFSDPRGDTISYLTPKLSDNSPLPSWITFSGSMFSFNTSIQREAEVTLTVVNSHSLAASQTFTVTITNQAPVVVSHLGVFSCYESRTSTYSINLSTVFSDPESQPLTFSVDSGPSFVVPSISGSILNLSVSPAQGDVGTHSVVVLASDGSKNITDTLTISVDENYPPAVPVLSNIYANEGVAGSHTVGAFTDPEGDPITYAMKFANGSALDPAWITFSPASRVVSFTPPNGSPTVIYLTVIASDPYNGPVDAQLELRINLAPKVNTTVTMLNYSMVTQKNSNFTVPGGLFYDEDATLSYVLTNTDNSPAPAWLHFSPPQSTVSGNFEFDGYYPIFEEKEFEFKLVAEDSAGLTQSVSIFVNIIRKSIASNVCSSLSPNVSDMHRSKCRSVRDLLPWEVLIP